MLEPIKSTVGYIINIQTTSFYLAKLFSSRILKTLSINNKRFQSQKCNGPKNIQKFQKKQVETPSFNTSINLMIIFEAGNNKIHGHFSGENKN